MTSLEGWGSAIELRPRDLTGAVRAGRSSSVGYRFRRGPRTVVTPGCDRQNTRWHTARGLEVRYRADQELPRQTAKRIQGWPESGPLIVNYDPLPSSFPSRDRMDWCDNHFTAAPAKLAETS
jgi:hypothetical protein